MKKKFLPLLLIPMLLSGCGANNEDDKVYETHNVSHALKTGDMVFFLKIKDALV